MELKVSPPPTAEGLSLSDSVSDPEENEFSEDDDRNHKHRKRETLSQSMERDSVEQVLTRPFIKRKKPFQNVHYYQESDSRQRENRKRYNFGPPENDFSANFVKKRPDFATSLRPPMDLNQTTWANQLSSGEPFSGRGRAREFGSWGQCDSRFNSVDIALQMVQQGSVPPSLFAGRGLPNVSNAHNASWNGFGYIPGMPHNELATHHLSLQGNLRPAINPSLSIGIPRQRCRDFEERGFCLRGDMCPMEHGVNRIVVEDVQSLSQFNLPGSLPSVHLMGAPAGPGPLSSVDASSSSLLNSKGLHGKTSNLGMEDDGMAGADVYDPDQPLWTNNRPETSGAVLALNPSKIVKFEPSISAGLSDRQATICEGFNNEYNVRSNEATVGSHNASSSAWGITGSSNNRTGMKEKNYCTKRTSNDIENKDKDHEPPTGHQDAARIGKRINARDLPPQDSYVNAQSEIGPSFTKSSQRALRSLFVNGIPQMNNKREALLLHFRKFGEVIDIYTPLNSERAFVQYSKREEAEAALKSPDAVIGNRFIKLSWANRDNIPEDVMNGANNVSLKPDGVKVASVATHPSTRNKGKNDLQSITHKVSITPSPVAAIHASDLPKPVAFSGAQVRPPSQKKLESLELLKEELRKKQELLDQKRNDFRRQLDKLQKQATSLKCEVVSEHAAKIHKVGISADIGKKLSIPNGIAASPQSKLMANKSKPPEIVVHSNPRTNSSLALLDSPGLKPSIRPLAPLGNPCPLAPLGAPLFMNRFKLDNRPSAFKIMPPLPTGLANLAALKEHFSVYGDLSDVKIEDLECNDSRTIESCAAHIAFKTRSSAERAYMNGKCWQGNNLLFMWLSSNSSRNENGSRENRASFTKESCEPDSQLVGEFASVIPQKAADSGVVDAKIQERTSDVKNVDHDEDLQSRSPKRSCEEQSLEVEGGGDGC